MKFEKNLWENLRFYGTFIKILHKTDSFFNQNCHRIKGMLRTKVIEDGYICGQIDAL